MSSFCDVLVVGGGPAGSSCAWRLASSGVDVVVLDRARFPRDKVCGGWIVPAVARTLALDLDEYASTRVLQPITAFRTGLIGGPTSDVQYPHVVSYGIRRCEFDWYLLQRSGARLVQGEPVASIERRSDCFVVNGHLRARTLVGAGGHFCPVAAWLNGPHRGGSVVVAKEVEFALDARQQESSVVDGQMPEIYFSPDLGGYGWCFRKGHYLNVGLGHLDAHDLPRRCLAFLAFLRDEHRVPDAVPTAWPGHAYRLFDAGRGVAAAPGVLLAGDAVGLAYAESGEGIRPAVESGLMTAEVILENRGQVSARAGKTYERRLARRYGRGLAAGAAAALVPGAISRALAPLALRSRWVTRHLVLDRWFLHAHVPPLAIRSLR